MGRSQLLKVRHARSCSTEIQYVLDMVLRDFLGLEYSPAPGGRPADGIQIEDGGRSLTVVTTFFDQVARHGWLHEATLPGLPLATIDLQSIPFTKCAGNSFLPVLFGLPVVRHDRQSVECGIDLFGSIFFMLSRYEEAVLPDRDQHDRFPAEASSAFRAGFLERPLVNEYVELLWMMLTGLWPGLQRREREFRQYPSHDVDVPFEDAFRSAYWTSRRFLGDIVKRRSLTQASANLRRWLAVRRGDRKRDRNNTFDFIMSESERRGLQSSFYFMPDGSDEQVVRYRVTHPVIRDLLTAIDERGHEIGLHATYGTYLDSERTVAEAGRLRAGLQAAGITQPVRGGRQHYLRWRTPDTARNWEAAEMVYDTTLGFATRPGFRCGTCWEFPLYDVMRRKPLRLVERPLVVMESSITSPTYMDLGLGPEAFDVFRNLKNVCRQHRGNFTILWHNDELITPEQRELYLAVLDC